MFKVLGDERSEANALNNIGSVHQNAGRPQQALQFYEQTLPLLEKIELSGSGR